MPPRRSSIAHGDEGGLAADDRLRPRPGLKRGEPRVKSLPLSSSPSLPAALPPLLPPKLPLRPPKPRRLAACDDMMLASKASVPNFPLRASSKPEPKPLPARMDGSGAAPQTLLATLLADFGPSETTEMPRNEVAAIRGELGALRSCDESIGFNCMLRVDDDELLSSPSRLFAKTGFSWPLRLAK